MLAALGTIKIQQRDKNEKTSRKKKASGNLADLMWVSNGERGALCDRAGNRMQTCRIERKGLAGARVQTTFLFFTSGSVLIDVRRPKYPSYSYASEGVRSNLRSKVLIDTPKIRFDFV